MAQLRYREVSRARGECRLCHASAVLVVTESRYVRRWYEGPDARFDPQLSRTATCSRCAATYPVRSTDESAAGAERRGEGEGHFRDWNYRRTA